ncbi:arylformamidase [Sutcliffiella horikoshii]|uniref:arylformamidase n=1 Tax=Sutcliffiella horikoshii TaxID=79883 RepID=UPI002041E427|nr:arylformamidase [Sutcliffiella horikoshii]MCM3616764.1 arylformamidase [Sutcliffiella horikoshii]
MKVYDISRPLSEKTPTWPGDTPFSYNVNWSKQHTGSVNVGSVKMSVHTATHVDAPYHFDDKGKRMDELDLSVFIGQAIVVDVSKHQSVELDHVEELLTLHPTKRILFKTNAWKEKEKFPTDIPTLSANVVRLLGSLHTPLIGVDLPSVDYLDSKELPIHHALHQANICILEGIDLSEVEEGEYELIALPLKLKGTDGSPVRAILVKN